MRMCVHARVCRRYGLRYGVQSYVARGWIEVRLSGLDDGSESASLGPTCQIQKSRKERDGTRTNQRNVQ